METIHSNYSPTFLYIDKYKFSNQWVYQENNIPYSLLRYIFQGTATFVINDISYEVKANDVCYIPQGATSQSLQTNLRIILDSTICPDAALKYGRRFLIMDTI